VVAKVEDVKCPHCEKENFVLAVHFYYAEKYGMIRQTIKCTRCSLQVDVEFRVNTVCISASIPKSAGV
jgi:transposase-like protein